MCAVSTSKFRGQFLSCYLCNDSGICLRATDNLNQIAYHHCPLFLFGFKQFSIDLGLSVLELYQICFSSQSGIDMGKLRLGSLHNQVTIFFLFGHQKNDQAKNGKGALPRKKEWETIFTNRVLDSNCECNFTFFSPFFRYAYFVDFFLSIEFTKYSHRHRYFTCILSDLFYAHSSRISTKSTEFDKKVEVHLSNETRISNVIIIQSYCCCCCCCWFRIGYK